MSQNPYTPKTREEFEAYCRAMDEANEAVIRSAMEREQETMDKDYGGMSPPATLPPPRKNVNRKCRKPSREEAQRIADEEMKRALFTDPIED